MGKTKVDPEFRWNNGPGLRSFHHTEKRNSLRNKWQVVWRVWNVLGVTIMRCNNDSAGRPVDTLDEEDPRPERSPRSDSDAART